IFAIQLRRRGRAARHRSAKPSTPVRIRTMPLKELLEKVALFFCKFLEKIN
ncbi:MAG: hypothetical protein RI980_2023, partial [Bacteroidota bacterium]